MLIVIAKCKVREGKLEDFLTQAVPLIAATRMEKGCISYQLVKDTTSTDTVAFVEKWENKEVLDIHMKSEHFTSILPKLTNLIDGDMDLSVNSLLI